MAGGIAAACTIFAAAAFAQQPTPAPVAPGEFRVTLLGTGSPAPVMRRFGPAVLVQAGGRNLLIDSGRGVTQRLMQLGLKLGEIEPLFITHLHSDHIVGIPDLWLTGWLEAGYAQRKGPFRVRGPAGTQNLMDGLVQAFDWDIKARIADQNLDPANLKPEVTEIRQGVVYDQAGVKVTAFDVDHGELLKPAFGYRIDYAGRSVTISGDTRFSENLIKHATGTDLLIHQVAAARAELLEQATFKVEDNRPGLPDDLVHRLESGQSLRDPPRKRIAGGIGGLGLALAQRVALLHGGSLRALPAPQGGPRLCLALPLAM